MTGTKERIAGRVMQWEGKATGDPIRETEGKALSAFGRLRSKKALTIALAVGAVIIAMVIPRPAR